MHHKPFCQQMNPNKKCMLSSVTRSGGCQNCSQHNDEENRACCADDVIASKIVDEYWSPLRKAHEFLKQSQTQEDASSHFQRSMGSLHQRSWLASLGLHS
ncbi:hypothetical protein Peur_074005 [Populus x canadensis]